MLKIRLKNLHTYNYVSKEGVAMDVGVSSVPFLKHVNRNSSNHKETIKWCFKALMQRNLLTEPQSATITMEWQCFTGKKLKVRQLMRWVQRAVSVSEEFTSQLELSQDGGCSRLWRSDTLQPQYRRQGRPWGHNHQNSWLPPELISPLYGTPVDHHSLPVEAKHTT